MYGSDTKSQFLYLRAKGWSLAKIAEKLQVAQRTLVDWNRQEHEQIRVLKAIELEALQEKYLMTREHELAKLRQDLDRLESELSKRSVEAVATENLYRLAAMLRAELRRVCQAPLPVEDACAAEK